MTTDLHLHGGFTITAKEFPDTDAKKGFRTIKICNGENEEINLYFQPESYPEMDRLFNLDVIVREQ